jgi:glyoxylase-like metal-dependent hydrolase (beta-lactamase superfamily II)
VLALEGRGSGDQLPAAYVDTRRVGEATVTIISDGTLPGFPFVAWLRAPAAAVRRAVPEADAHGALAFGMNVAHVRIGDASILVDPGWGEPSPAHTGGLAISRTPGVQAGLASIGVAPEEVTHVLITHAHWDHICGATVESGGRRAVRYPRARHLLGRAEWVGNPAREDRDSAAAVHLGALERLGLLELVEDDREAVPGVAMLHAPGESPGHHIVRVASAGERFYYLGDLFHHPCEVDHPDWVPPGPAPARPGGDARVARAPDGGGRGGPRDACVRAQAVPRVVPHRRRGDGLPLGGRMTRPRGRGASPRCDRGWQGRHGRRTECSDGGRSRTGPPRRGGEAAAPPV